MNYFVQDYFHRPIHADKYSKIINKQERYGILSITYLWDKTFSFWSNISSFGIRIWIDVVEQIWHTV